MTEIGAMGSYGVYVYGSYLLMAVVVGLNWWLSARRERLAIEQAMRRLAAHDTKGETP